VSQERSDDSLTHSGEAGWKDGQVARLVEAGCRRHRAEWLSGFAHFSAGAVDAAIANLAEARRTGLKRKPEAILVASIKNNWGMPATAEQKREFRLPGHVAERDQADRERRREADAAEAARRRRVEALSDAELAEVVDDVLGLEADPAWRETLSNLKGRARTNPAWIDRICWRLDARAVAAGARRELAAGESRGGQ